METQVNLYGVVTPTKLDFEYNYSENRTRKTVSTRATVNDSWTVISDTAYIYNGSQVVAELDKLNSDKLERTYHYGNYVDECLMLTNYDAQGTGTTVYPQHDRQYSVRALVDGSGSIIESYDYSPMGKITTFDANGSQISESAHGNSYGYTGRRLDQESGLWYFRARYYSDDLGRFLSRDPKGYIDGLSMYTAFFAEKFGMDPLGLEFIDNGYKYLPWKDYIAYRGASVMMKAVGFTDTKVGFKERGKDKIIEDNNNGCFCAKLVEAKQFDLEVESVILDPLDMLNHGASVWASKISRQILIAHEAKRRNAMKKAYNKFIDKLNNIAPVRICRKAPGEAKRMLIGYLADLRKWNMEAYFLYNSNLQLKIGEETRAGNIIIKNGRVIGYKKEVTSWDLTWVTVTTPGRPEPTEPSNNCSKCPFLNLFY